MQQRLVRFDWAMKKLLRSKANFGILEGFLSELLKQDLQILELLESESNQVLKDDKQNRVDILVKLESDEIVLIEIQTNNEYDFFYRMLFGVSKAVTEHLKQGATYDQIKKVYSVNILYFDLGQGDDYIYHGTTNFIGLHQNDTLNLSEKQRQVYAKKSVHQLFPEYYLIKVNQFNDIAKDTLDQWIYFLKNEEIKDNFNAKGLIEARNTLESFRLSPDEQALYKKYIEDLRYEASMVKSIYDFGKAEGRMEGRVEGMEIGRAEGKAEGIAEGLEKGKAEGIAEGLEKGIAEGLEKGIAEGLEKGKADGRAETMLEIARRMRDAGAAAELIQQVTGLSPREIE